MQWTLPAAAPDHVDRGARGSADGLGVPDGGIRERRAERAGSGGVRSAHRLVERAWRGARRGLPATRSDGLVARTRATETTVSLLLEEDARSIPRFVRVSVRSGECVTSRQRGERLTLLVQDVCVLRRRSIVSLASEIASSNVTGARESFRTHSPCDGERRQVTRWSERQRLAALRQRVLESTLPIERLGEDVRCSSRASLALQPPAASRTRRRGSPRARSRSPASNSTSAAERRPARRECAAFGRTPAAPVAPRRGARAPHRTARPLPRPRRASAG